CVIALRWSLHSCPAMPLRQTVHTCRVRASSNLLGQSVHFMALANAEFVKPLEPDKKPPGTEMFDRRRPLTLCRRRSIKSVVETSPRLNNPCPRLHTHARELLLAEDIPRVRHLRAFLRDWPHLDRVTVGEGRAPLCDLHRLVHALRQDQHITADRFLRLRERSVRHRAASLAGNGPALGPQRLAALHDALLH